MLKRVIALTTVVLLVLLVLITFVLGITGSPHFLGMFFLTVLVPIFIWAILLVYKKKTSDKMDEQIDKNSKEKN